MDNLTTHVENPEKHEIKNNRPDMSLHKSKIQGWESMKILIYGNHRYDFYKLIPCKEYAIPILKMYFDHKEVVRKTKKLKELFKEIEDIRWYPLDRLYIKAKWCYSRYPYKEEKSLDLSKKEDRDIFLEKNKFTAAEFITWVLFVSEWESITSIDDIINNFSTLLNKFINFSRTDYTPETLQEKYNFYLKKKIKEHKIELLDKITHKDYYTFVTNQLIASISVSAGLRRLFAHVNNSLFLKGLKSGFNPSFPRYIKFLDKILNYKYDDRYKDFSSIKRLEEHEVLIYDEDNNETTLRSDFFIPDYVKKKYRFITSGWEVEEKEKDTVSMDELDIYKNILKHHPTIEGYEIIEEIIKEIKDNISEKDARTSLETITKYNNEREIKTLPKTEEERLKKIKKWLQDVNKKTTVSGEDKSSEKSNTSEE